ncbi:hypothetical protein CTI12_AA330080 [Artemisia annua]|uniref:Helitron helicase-like domain-containing protein n=1 Tax=Artemisia annua TaxID=35608 RepID=A0A2U1MYZ4_ARTAN|nr:hypothetical protein CTI12_AA330080 [Artemisia annua]
MRIKTKAASNELATSMPMEGIESSVFHSQFIHGDSGVTSAVGFVGPNANPDSVNAIHYPTSSAGLTNGILEVPHSNILATDGHTSSSSVLQVPLHGSLQSGVAHVLDSHLHNVEDATAETLQRSNDVWSVPVQVPTIDGSVSTFIATTSVTDLPVNAQQHASLQGTSDFCNHAHAHDGPVILNFASTDVLGNNDAMSDTSNAGAARPQIARRTRRRRRAHGMRGPANRQRARTDCPDTMDAHALPTQGPVAPPQREGAPLDYVSFGGCDQICQHCGALFWLEEKKAGLAASVPPQYRKCCAGGRAHERQALQQEIIEGLIQFLNLNNALVRLFRTARDKLLEADIPNFQIRLFGVVGANQYELPTADTIGAIVYEGGPECMTDYDVVIERHSREPESKFRRPECRGGKKDDNESLLCIPTARQSW